MVGESGRNDRMLSAHFVHVISEVLDCTQVCDQGDEVDELVPTDCGGRRTCSFLSFRYPFRFINCIVQFITKFGSDKNSANFVCEL